MSLSLICDQYIYFKLKAIVQDLLSNYIFNAIHTE